MSLAGSLVCAVTTHVSLTSTSKLYLLLCAGSRIDDVAELAVHAVNNPHLCDKLAKLMQKDLPAGHIVVLGKALAPMVITLLASESGIHVVETAVMRLVSCELIFSRSCFPIALPRGHQHSCSSQHLRSARST